MQRLASLLVFALICSSASASESECSSIAAKFDGPENNFRPPLEAVLIGASDVAVFSAPNPRCTIIGKSIRSGSHVTLYKKQGGWFNVMYIANDGTDISGWVQNRRLKIVGQYGNNP